MINRYTVLHSLVDFTKSISELRSLLGSLQWDFDGPSLAMNREHFRRVLERYLNGDISSQEIEDWANLVEGREDIVFEAEDAQLLREVVYELANPELVERLSKHRARELVSQLVKL